MQSQLRRGNNLEKSSRVPKPPGIAIKAPESSAITAFRSCMLDTRRSSVRPYWANSLEERACGITPITSHFSSRTASAATTSSGQYCLRRRRAPLPVFYKGFRIVGAASVLQNIAYSWNQNADAFYSITL